MLCTVDFGSGYAGLLTVGYQVADEAGQVVVARTTAGVYEIGNGFYGAVVDLPEGFVGTIQWSIAAGSSITAGEQIAVRTAGGDADAWLDRADGIETGITPRQALRAMASALVGVVNGVNGGAATITFQSIGGSASRIVATVDGNGNRTAIELDL